MTPWVNGLESLSGVGLSYLPVPVDSDINIYEYELLPGDNTFRYSLTTAPNSLINASTTGC